MRLWVAGIERLSASQKIVRVNRRLFQDGSKSSFGHVSGMIRYGRVAFASRVEADFVAASSLAVKSESVGPQPSNDLSVPESCQANHFQAATTMV